MTASPRPLHAAPATSGEDYPSPLVAWSAVAVLFILGAVAFLDHQIISLMVDDIRRDLAISDFQVSLLQGFAFALCYAVMGIPLGWLVDRFPRRQIICVGVIAWAIAAAACGLARNFWQLLLARLGVGLGDVLPDAHLAAITAVGGLLLVGVALRLLKVREIAVADMLPALLVAPLLVEIVAACR